MDKDLKTILLEALKAKGISIPKFASIIDVPKDRIYKWYQQGSSPKPEDAIKIERWLNNSNIPMLKTVPMSNQPLSSERKPDDYAELFKDRIKLLEANNAFLLKLYDERLSRIETVLINHSFTVEANLKMLLEDQKLLLDNQKLLMRQVSVSFHLINEMLAQGDQKKSQQFADKFDKLMTLNHV